MLELLVGLVMVAVAVGIFIFIGRICNLFMPVGDDLGLQLIVGLFASMVTALMLTVCWAIGGAVLHGS